MCMTGDVQVQKDSPLYTVSFAIWGINNIYKDTKYLPATVRSMNIACWHRMRPNKVEISDAFKHHRTDGTVKFLHARLQHTGFSRCKFVCILMSFMFWSCVDIFLLAQEFCWKIRGSFFPDSSKQLFTPSPACIPRCNHDFRSLQREWHKKWCV